MPTINDVIDQQPEIRKLALLVPMRGKVDCIFMQTYLSLFIHLLKKRGIVAQPVFSDMMPLDKARCSLARSAIINRADYALWLDADIVLNESMFERLWEALHGKDGTPEERQVVTGIYYERELPYDAVIRRKNELGLYEKIMQFPEKEPFAVDGIGFGFVLMKMKPLKDVFAATKGYPFKWTDNVSEDLYFCDRLAEAGHKIWAVPTVNVPHYGSYVTQWHYLHYKLDEYSDLQELARYRKINSEECYQRCSNGSLNMCKAWQAKFGKDADESLLKEEDILDFYRNTDLYIYDLTWFWSHNRKMREEITGKWKPGIGKVLDFGCGIGDYGLEYAMDNPSSDVDFYDINIHNLDYLEYRIGVYEAQKLVGKGKLKVYNEAHGNLLKKQEGVYGMIFAIDVLEHIKNPEETVAALRRMLSRNGTLYAQVAAKGAFQPQHISEIDLAKHGFLQTDAYTYIRTDSDVAANYARMVQNVKDNMTVTPMKKDADGRRGD